MPYRVEVGPQAAAQLAELDAAIGASIERKILWLAENAPVVVHRRLTGMPNELEGLCKLRVGDYRILYWIYPRENWSAFTVSVIAPTCIATCELSERLQVLNADGRKHHIATAPVSAARSSLRRRGRRGACVAGTTRDGC